MRKGAKKCYDFGTKKQWRKWWWNRIRERLKGMCIQPSKAIVLYLAGKEDHERKVAVGKYFKPYNLFAIERCKKTAAYLRKKGVNTINDKVHNILSIWHSEPYFSVLSLDMCCGITEAIDCLILSLLWCPGMHENGCVVALNLLRGRDPLIREARKSDNFQLNLDLLKITLSTNNIENPDKHRGLIFYSILLRTVWNSDYYHDKKCEAFHDFDKKRPELAKFLNSLDPIFYSYKSDAGHQYFDSVIFKWKPVWNYGRRTTKEDYARGLLNVDKKTRKKIKSCHRKICAAKAIRTMRFQGKL